MASTPKGRNRGDGLPSFSPALCRFFTAYLKRYFRRHFAAVYTSGPTPPRSKPLIVYSNHPSWWDPIHFFLLAHFELPGTRVYGPMEAKALEKYRFFKRLGAFGVELGTRRGAADFVRTALAVLEQPGASLWLTAEGRFTDPRQRPLRLESGIGHLARRLDDGWIVPLAVEYPFWNESRPVVATRFGTPIDIAAAADRSSQGWTRLLTQRLEQTMDSLANDVRSRDPLRFRTLIHGRVGVGGIYDVWRRLNARTRGERFDVAHGDRPR
jgi:1-acyl-sn-glycerol-3-phosphate acyltransferase